MLLVLVVLCATLSYATWTNQSATGPDAARTLAASIAAKADPGAAVLVAAGAGKDDISFARTVQTDLKSAGFSSVLVVNGEPRDVRKALVQLAAENQRLSAVAATAESAGWLVFQSLPTDFPALGQPEFFTPQPYSWPTFLKADNLLNIANQISVIAILAIGMTVVVLTGGIDLSVGSLIALAAVTCCLFIEWQGAEAASTAVVIAGAAVGILVTAVAGLINGLIITQFRVPPFIVTLAMMLIASGSAFLLTGGESVYRIPEGFKTLGVGSAIGRIPNAAILTLALYGAAYVLLRRTIVGRYIYAIGGNREAARLSGIRVNRVLIFAYVLSGLLAGLGGVVMASQLNSGSPKFGQSYELYVIAAVVVGGTSLAGGEGSVLGTMIGVLIISVIRNGMNLLSVDAYTQNIVLGCVILGAVLLDNLKRRRPT